MAIENNTCPFCGGDILPEELKDGIATLGKLIDSLLDTDEEFVMQFLNERYGIGKSQQSNSSDSSGSKRTNAIAEEISKIISNEPQTDENGEPTLAEKLKDKNFRAEYLKKSKQPDLANLAKKIQTGSNQKNDDQDSDDYYSDESDDFTSLLQSTLNGSSKANGSLSDKEKRDLALQEKVINKSKQKFIGRSK